MLPSAIRDRLLVDEAQLGQRLNRDLRQGDRADFRLHLALLSGAVEDQPWFGDKPLAAPGAREWRAHFGLPAQAPLQGKWDDADGGALNERLQQGGCMTDVRLWLALRTPPLLSEAPALDPAVYDNLSALGRERWQEKQATRSLASQPREEELSLMLPLLDELKSGVDARLRWLG
ncbi:VC2046/SO_2500 family protein [Aeromonas eucrenophila]|uniref:VC2046/SO_2500 family protein n=1 Tax=Aeromonas eucrenophila TaxID=649 RepID=A0ABW0YGF1_9GAMM|nr:VC2046/SO_2500 family protein [Aeromonas eucrenophila]